MSSIGRRIKTAATEAGLSLRELGDRLGVSHATIYAFVSGSLEPNENRIESIAKETGKPRDYFFSDGAVSPFSVLSERDLELAQALMTGPDLPAASQILERGIVQLGSTVQGHVLLRYGTVLLLQGRYHEAIITLQEAREALKSEGDNERAGSACQSLGFCFANIGLLNQAESCFFEAKELLSSSEQWRPELALAVVNERRGRYEETLLILATVERRFTDAEARMYARSVRANLSASMHDWLLTAELEDEALTRAVALGSADQIAERGANLALALIHLNDLEGASLRLAECRVAVAIAKDLARQAHADTVESMLAIARGGTARAKHLAARAMETAIAGEFRRAELAAHLRYCEIAFTAGHWQDAAQFALHAKAFAARYLYASEEDTAELVLSATYLARDDAQQARGRLESVENRGRFEASPLCRALVDGIRASLDGKPWANGAQVKRDLAAAGHRFSPLFGHLDS